MKVPRHQVEEVPAAAMCEDRAHPGSGHQHLDRVGDDRAERADDGAAERDQDRQPDDAAALAERTGEQQQYLRADRGLRHGR